MLLPSLGFTLLSLSQLGGTDFSERALNAGFKWTKLLGRFAIESNAEITALAITTSLSGTSTRVANGSLLLSFNFGKGPWEILLKTGGIYSTMFVTNDAFGYKNLESGQLGLGLGRSLSGLITLETELKFTPITSFSGLNFSDRQIDAGVKLDLNFKTHPWVIAYNYSSLQIVSVSSPLTLSSHLLSLAIGFR